MDFKSRQSSWDSKWKTHLQSWWNELDEKRRNEFKTVKNIKEGSIGAIAGVTGSGKSTDGVLGVKYQNMEKFVVVCTTTTCSAHELSKYTTRKKLKLPSDCPKICSRTGKLIQGYQQGESEIYFSTYGWYAKYLKGIMQNMDKKTKEALKNTIIIFDEAHERSLAQELLMYFTKELLQKNIIHAIIYSSATMDENEFKNYYTSYKSFFKLEISSLLSYKVEIEYLEKFIGLFVENSKQKEILSLFSKLNDDVDELNSIAVVDEDNVVSPQLVREIIKMSANFVKYLVYENNNKLPMLIFCPGLRQILDIAKIIRSIDTNNKINIHMCHSELPESGFHELSKLIEGKVNVILATNMYESAVTIDNVDVVIDLCWIRVMSYKNGFDYLEFEFASQYQQTQRAGRIGRTGNGMCYRMIPSWVYEKLPKNIKPAIRRVGISKFILDLIMGKLNLLKGLNLKQPQHFNVFEELKCLLSYPKEKVIKNCLIELNSLSLIQFKSQNNHLECGITKVGKLVTIFPLNFHYSLLLSYGYILRNVRFDIFLCAIVYSCFLQKADVLKDDKDVNNSKAKYFYEKLEFSRSELDEKIELFLHFYDIFCSCRGFFFPNLNVLNFFRVLRKRCDEKSFISKHVLDCFKKIKKTIQSFPEEITEKKLCLFFNLPKDIKVNIPKFLSMLAFRKSITIPFETLGKTNLLVLQEEKNGNKVDSKNLMMEIVHSCVKYLTRYKDNDEIENVNMEPIHVDGKKTLCVSGISDNLHHVFSKWGVSHVFEEFTKIEKLRNLKIKSYSFPLSRYELCFGDEVNLRFNKQTHLGKNEKFVFDKYNYSSCSKNEEIVISSVFNLSDVEYEFLLYFSYSFSPSSIKYPFSKISYMLFLSEFQHGRKILIFYRPKYELNVQKISFLKKCLKLEKDVTKGTFRFINSLGNTKEIVEEEEMRKFINSRTKMCVRLLFDFFERKRNVCREKNVFKSTLVFVWTEDYNVIKCFFENEIVTDKFFEKHRVLYNRMKSIMNKKKEDDPKEKQLVEEIKIFLKEGMNYATNILPITDEHIIYFNNIVKVQIHFKPKKKKKKKKKKRKKKKKKNENQNN